MVRSTAPGNSQKRLLQFAAISGVSKRVFWWRAQRAANSICGIDCFRQAGRPQYSWPIPGERHCGPWVRNHCVHTRISRTLGRLYARRATVGLDAVPTRCAPIGFAFSRQSWRRAVANMLSLRSPKPASGHQSACWPALRRRARALVAPFP